jgi:MoaA/NifB/PqqE/SkfB family radical SAM enzyme
MKEDIIRREYYQGPVGTSPFVYSGYVCNNNCKFCFEKDQKFSEKSTDDLKKEIRTIRKKFPYINFMGKEPTLRKDIIDLIKYSSTLKFDQIGITTNGRMFFYPDFTNRILKAGLDQVVVTVAGHTEKLHEFHTQAKESFAQTLGGIKNIIGYKSQNQGLVLNIMITRKNISEIEKMVDFYYKIGVREINIGHILPFNKEIIRAKNFVARMKTVVPHLISVLEKYGGKIKFLFVEYPPCIFPEKYRCLSFPCLEESPQKKHFSLCRECPYKKKCNGVHKFYIDLYGTSEFKL